MYPMTITIANAAQFDAVRRALDADAVRQSMHDEATAEAPIGAFDAPAPSPAAKGKERKSAPKAEPTKAKAEQPTPAAEPHAEQPVATYEQVKTAILEVSRAKGRDAAVALLAQFGAARDPELQDKPETFGPFVAAAKALLS